jgi:two-component system LytT family response regulator
MALVSMSCAIGPEHMPAVIFIAAYDQYAVRAFEMNAVDYLLKPFGAINELTFAKPGRLVADASRADAVTKRFSMNQRGTPTQAR